jgi:hypothetical protein
MTSHDEQRLSDALRRQAASADPTLLTLDDVTSRARGIRRRRAATGIVAAAAVAAIVVPTAMLATDRVNDSDQAPIANSPSVTATGTGDPTQSPTERFVPTRHVDVSVVGDLPNGDAPRSGVLVGSEIVTADGARVPAAAGTLYFAQVGSSWVSVVRTDSDQAVFQVRDADGDVQLESPANVDGALTVTPDRTAAAYVDTDQRIHTWTESDGDRAMSGPIDGIRLGPMTGSTTCGATADEECVVVFNRGVGGAGYAASTGASEEIPGFLNVRDAADRSYAGQTESFDEGSCSQIRRTDNGRTLLETCDYFLEEFSPDGLYISASPAYGDGPGPSTYDVLDAANGKSVLTLKAAVGGDRIAYMPQVTWEDDSHLLVVVFDGQEWRVVRVGLDGSAELADAGAMPSGDDGEIPVRIEIGS